jgi:hypothetical protein
MSDNYFFTTFNEYSKHLSVGHPLIHNFKWVFQTLHYRTSTYSQLSLSIPNIDLSYIYLFTTFINYFKHWSVEQLLIHNFQWVDQTLICRTSSYSQLALSIPNINLSDIYLFTTCIKYFKHWSVEQLLIHNFQWVDQTLICRTSTYSQLTLSILTLIRRTTIYSLSFSQILCMWYRNYACFCIHWFVTVNVSFFNMWSECNCVLAKLYTHRRCYTFWILISIGAICHGILMDIACHLQFVMLHLFKYLILSITFTCLLF